jgi:mutator protein MutT
MPDAAPIDVACLILMDATGAILATRRPRHKTLGGYWEFPGGKLDAGETADAALRREIREELQLELGTLAPLPAVQHHYDFATIRLLPFLSRCRTRPVLHPTEHEEICWVSLAQTERLVWTPADVPVLSYLKTLDVR